MTGEKAQDDRKEAPDDKETKGLRMTRRQKAQDDRKEAPDNKETKGSG